MELIDDERRALLGIVAQADLPEAPAGEVVDTDDDASMIRRDDGSSLADGARPFDGAFAPFGMAVLPPDAGECRTLAAFVLARLGRIPVTGDAVECDVGGETWRFAVTRMDGRRIDGGALSRPA